MAISTDMLTAFVRVAEHRSVSTAGADLGVCKSVVSKRIAQLETAVKATLFSRSTRKIALTPAGATHPYGKDPHDRTLRIAPTFPKLDAVRKAAEAVALCTLLAAVEARADG